MTEILFSPWKLGSFETRNRVVMAPMTRSRSPGNSPGDIVAQYYAQRAEAGLIITEGTAPSPNGLGYARIPGLFSASQAQDWRKVTHEVHKAGGRIFIQLMHTGRVSHPLNMPAGSRILAPSPVGLTGKMWTDQQGEQPFPVPQEMTGQDIQATITEYIRSSELAIEAGFDGVELHGANGYLINQFLNTASNQRQDSWGGSIGNRIRFAVEIARQMLWRKKQLWFIGATAAVVVGVAALGFRVWGDRGNWETLASLQATNNTKILAAKKLTSDYKSKGLSFDNDKAIVEGYVKLADQRSIWPYLVRDIYEALPQATKPSRLPAASMMPQPVRCSPGSMPMIRMASRILET